MKNILSNSKSIFILFWSFLLLFPYSCSKESPQDNEGNLAEINLQSIKITGTDASSVTKTTLNGLTTSWVAGTDIIGVFCPQARPVVMASGPDVQNFFPQTKGAVGVNNAQYTATTSAPTSEFTGTMYWGTTNPHKFYAYYPFANGSPVKEIVGIKLSDIQQQAIGKNSEHIGALDFMVATPLTVAPSTENTPVNVHFLFNHVFSLLEFQIINGGNITEVKLTGNGPVSLSSGTINITQATPANNATAYIIDSPVYGNDITLTINAPLATTADYTTTPKIYMMALPKSITGYLDIAIKSGGTYKFIQKELPSGGFDRGMKYVVHIDAAAATFYPGTSLAPITIGATTWAPVNAGYINTVRPYGLLYQWGRKFGQEFEPFVVADVITGPVDVAVGNNAANVSKFYETSASETFNDWCAPQALTWDMTLYNPCPRGWRVPTTVELTALNTSGSTWVNTAPENPDGLEGRWFGGLHSTTHVGSVFMPAAGYRTSNLGLPYYRGVAGQYWSSVVSGNDASYLNFRVGYNFISTFYRAHGYSVRCVQD